MQGDLQAIAHAAWITYRDTITASGRKDRRSLRAREFFAGFQSGRDYGQTVAEANYTLRQMVEWADADPTAFEHWKASNPDTVKRLLLALYNPDERTPYDHRS